MLTKCFRFILFYHILRVEQMFFSCFEQFFCNSSHHLQRWENSCLFCVKIPFICARLLFGLATRAPSALAQSILDPPPKPMMALQLLERNKSIASATFFVVGLATVLSYIVYLILFSESTFSRRFVRPSFMIPSSVIISTWLYLRFSRISGKALTLPRILGFLYGRNGSAIRNNMEYNDRNRK